MTKPVLVLVGHGMVGHHFLEQCVSRNLHQQYRIVVFGEERYPAYDRVHLSEYFAGRSAESLSLAAGDFFIEHGIELRLGEAVATIDREARLVRDAEGHEIHWDKLVLATGSYPFVPPIPGNDLAGCFVYRTLDDLDRIAAHAAAAKSGVVIGGGLLGLEAANALKQLGLETQVVEFAPNLMAVQLDNGGAAMLREKIVALGVGVHTSKATTAIVREADGLRLNFADGGALRTDMVVFSAGIRPQDALARGCALQVGERGGIHIDGQCRTSDPDVLAIGECALWDNKIYGLVAPGYQMARIAAATLAGEDACFSGADMSTKLKLLGVDVASFGDAQGRTPGCQSYQWTDGPQQIYKKIVVSQDGKALLGGVLVGDASDYATLLQMMQITGSSLSLGLSDSTYVVLGRVVSLASFALMLVRGMFAKWFYRKSAAEHIRRIRAEFPDAAQRKAVLCAQGGTSWAAVLGCLVLLMVIGSAFTLLLGPNVDALIHLVYG